MGKKVPESVRKEMVGPLEEAVGFVYECDCDWSAWADKTMESGNFSPWETAEHLDSLATAIIDACLEHGKGDGEKWVVSEELLSAVDKAVSSALGDALDCTRVWSAWGYGTMSEEDFVLVSEDSDRVREIGVAGVECLIRNLNYPSAKILERTAREFGAAVEKAEDGNYNFFLYPNNVAFGAPIPLSEGDFATRKAAWCAAGKSLLDRGLAKPYEDEPYQGWSNSATWAVSLYSLQERRLYEHAVLSIKSENGPVDLEKLFKNMGISYVRNKDDDAPCGLQRGGVIRLDSWVKGDVNWKEISENLASEILPQKTASPSA